MIVESVHVVIPTHNEEARLGGCLDSVRTASETLLAHRPSIVVRTVVALDCCTDRSADIATAAGVEVVVLDAGSVGAARRAGLTHVEWMEIRSPERVWIASTDADTVVSADWLVDQVELAERGHDLVVGLVRPDPAELSALGMAAWIARHPPADGHVHGANLGFRLSTYREAGGFPAVSEHEDVSLIRAIQATGRRWAVGSRVTTSARLTGRTPGGFAGYLRALSLELDA